MRHLHLDLVGGLSGDMFISTMLDAFPDLAEGLDGVIVEAGFPDMVTLQAAPHNDGVLTGTHFTVSAEPEEGHHHRHYSEIKARLEASALPAATKQGALQMFLLIAEVEAAIHGKSVESVAFHEVGAWDSIADIVLASHLIAAAAASWSVSAVPAGSGFVETAHGRLPVPAPATARLLEGFELLDDGLEGERVTPTGAAILKYLKPARRLPAGYQLDRTGYGFGSKKFPGISNVARVSVYEAQSSQQPWADDRVMRLSFDLDDQTPEEIAQAAEALRQTHGVLDVTQQAFWGKKNRQGFTLTILAEPGSTDSVLAACFNLTTTLGVRKEEVSRAILRREEVVVSVNQRSYRVKVAHRPVGLTAKIEMDDLMAADLTVSQQQEIRKIAEEQAIAMVST